MANAQLHCFEKIGIGSRCGFFFEVVHSSSSGSLVVVLGDGREVMGMFGDVDAGKVVVAVGRMGEMVMGSSSGASVGEGCGCGIADVRAMRAMRNMMKCMVMACYWLSRYFSYVRGFYEKFIVSCTHCFVHYYVWHFIHVSPYSDIVILKL